VWSEGRRYIDFTSGIFAANLGHNNDTVLDAVFTATRKTGPHSYSYGLPSRDEYLKRLCAWSGFEHAHLFTTGSEAVEAAMRVAWILGYGADDFYGLPGSFHGKTWGPDKILLRFNDTCDFASKDVAMVEGYRGWDAHFWEPEVIESVRCAGLVIVDEVQSGFGRTGKKFAHEYYKDLVPDMIVTGKGQGNGWPVSAVLANGRCAEVLRDHADEFSSTHGGNPVACAAGLAVLAEFNRSGFWNTVNANCMILQSGLADSPYPVNCEGMVAAVLAPTAKDADRIVLECRERRLLVVHTGKAAVKIGPPLTIPGRELAEGLEILISVLRNVSLPGLDCFTANLANGMEQLANQIDEEAFRTMEKQCATQD
jgi:acetylornithine/succinyldiaminopimelate/putrescine aminotransferase